MSLFTALSVSASGLAAQRTRVEVMVENVANAETTRTPSGGPYRPKEVTFETTQEVSAFASIFQSELNATGVKVSEIMEDMREPALRYIPGHPDADKNGYVRFPQTDPAMDMADMMSAMRSYDANVAAMRAVKDMISKTVDIIRA